MTLEEKAEKSFEKARKRNIGLSYGSYHDGYIAGATENSIVWHNLRKNPQYLPSRKGFETYSECLITDKGYGVYNFRKYRWYVDDPDCDCMGHTEVVAWCEIPEFKEV